MSGEIVKFPTRNQLFYTLTSIKKVVFSTIYFILPLTDCYVSFIFSFFQIITHPLKRGPVRLIYRMEELTFVWLVRKMANTNVFRWLEILEKEFDKAFVDLDILLGDIDEDQCEITYEGRRKMTALSSAFAQLSHKAQAIFGNNSSLEVSVAILVVFSLQV